MRWRCPVRTARKSHEGAFQQKPRGLIVRSTWQCITVTRNERERERQRSRVEQPGGSENRQVAHGQGRHGREGRSPKCAAETQSTRERWGLTDRDAFDAS
ncbi:hypothetical protein MRX96_028348 [Rhipicephalus microplus]